MFNFFKNIFSSDKQAVYSNPKHREFVEKKDIVEPFSKYEAAIHYTNGESESVYANIYEKMVNRIVLQSVDPRLESTYPFTASISKESYKPQILFDKSNDIVIPYSVIKKFEIKSETKLVAVAEDVEMRTVEKQYVPDGVWQKDVSYITEDALNASKGTVTVYEKSEWESKRKD